MKERSGSKRENEQLLLIRIHMHRAVALCVHKLVRAEHERPYCSLGFKASCLEM